MQTFYYTNSQLKKSAIIQTITFVTKSVSGTDTTTLKNLMEMIGIGGTHGAIPPERLLSKMQKLHTYVPSTCSSTLMVVADLLEIDLDTFRSIVFNNEDPAEYYTIQLPVKKDK